MTTTAYIDAGYLRGVLAHSTRSRRIRVDARGVVAIAAEVGGDELSGALWYDAAFTAAGPRREAQKAYLDAVGSIPGVFLRLGEASVVPPAWQQQAMEAGVAAGADPQRLSRELAKHELVKQKGVDGRLIVDVLMDAVDAPTGTSVVFAGDADLTPALLTARELGRWVVLVTESASCSQTLRAAANQVVELAGEYRTRIAG